MKCQILFSGKNKKNIINLSSAEKSVIVRSYILSFPWNQRFDKNWQSDFRGKVF